MAEGLAARRGAPALTVLGPIGAQDEHGERIPLKGPKHRELLALLVSSRGRVVTAAELVDGLRPEAPPARAVGTLRTFASDLRAAMEPHRSPRSPATVLIT